MSTMYLRIKHICLAVSLLTGVVHGDQFSIRSNGINSVGLGLTGDGIAIGMAELNRPGKHNFDTDPMLLNTFVDPEAVFLQDGPAVMDENIDSFGMLIHHPTEVASVMISPDCDVNGFTCGW